MLFSLSIDSNNAALIDGGVDEIANILGQAVADMRDGQRYGFLRDSNGNTVGHWDIEEEGV